MQMRVTASKCDWVYFQLGATVDESEEILCPFADAEQDRSRATIEAEACQAVKSIYKKG